MLPAGSAPGDRMERRGRLRDRLAGTAGELLAHRLDHLPLPRSALQGLCHRLAQLGERSAAARAFGRAGDNDTLAWQMRRQRIGLRRVKLLTKASLSVLSPAATASSAALSDHGGADPAGRRNHGDWAAHQVVP